MGGVVKVAGNPACAPAVPLITRFSEWRHVLLGRIVGVHRSLSGGESTRRLSGQLPDCALGDYPDPDYPERIIDRPPDGALIRGFEVWEEANAGQQGWTDCIAVDDAATCRVNDPWQQ